MGLQPLYATVPRIGAATLDALLDATLTTPPTHAVTVLVAGANGTKVRQVRFEQTATTAALSYVNLWLYDGANYYYLDAFQVQINTITPGSLQVPPLDKFFPALVLPAGWELRATTATTASVGNVFAFGADF